MTIRETTAQAIRELRADIEAAGENDWTLVRLATLKHVLAVLGVVVSAPAGWHVVNPMTGSAP